MKKFISQLTVRRNQLVLALGIGLLLLTLLVGTSLAHRSPPSHPSASAATVQAGSYTLSWSLSPNTPQASQTAHLSLHVTDTSKGQPVNDADVELRGVMESMDMLMGPIYTNSQGNGSYVTDMKFAMPGYWRMQVIIARLNVPTVSAQIEINSLPPQ